MEDEISKGNILRKLIILLAFLICFPCAVLAQVTEPVALEVLMDIKANNDCQNVLSDWQLDTTASGEGIMAAENGALARLDLAYKQLCGVLTVRNTTVLESLRAGDNPLDGVVLSGLYGLKELDLSYDRLANLDFLDGCPALEMLRLDGNVLTDIGMLAQLGDLRQLSLVYNHISDITPLKDLAALEELLLFHNKIGNITPLSGLYALKRLNLNTNNINDATALQELVNLEVLELADNRLIQASPLAGLINLHTLDLSGNRLRDIATLANLPRLTRLDLSGNLLRSISPLAHRLDTFEQLDLAGNALALHQMYDADSQSRWAAHQKDVYFMLRVQYMQVVNYWAIPAEDLEIDGVKSKVTVEGPKYGAYFDETAGRVIFSKSGVYTVSISNAKLFNAEKHTTTPVTKTGTIAVFEALPAEKAVIAGREEMVTPAMLKSLYVTLNANGVAEARDFSDPYYDMLWILSHMAEPSAF